LPYIFYRLSFKNKKGISLFWGRKINILPKDQEVFMLSIFGQLFDEREIRLTKFFIKNLKPIDVFYDLGANYGFYSCLAAEFCKEVHAFEPQHNIFENLEENFKNIQSVTLNNVAVSDQNKIITMYVNKNSSGTGTIIQKATQLKQFGGKSEIIEIPSITLNDYLKNHSKPTVVKLDVEGAESLVIKGGYDFFKDNSPIITMEVWSKDNGGEISMEAVSILEKLGYHPYFINNNGDLEHTPFILEENFKNEIKIENYVFIKK